MSRSKQRWAIGRGEHNRLSVIFISIVVVMIIVVVGIGSIGLIKKRDEQLATINNLNEQLAQENERKEEIAEYTKYTQTKQFIIDLAHDKLGLVMDGETVFKEDD